MATAHGQPSTDLKTALLTQGHRFTYIQAARLITLMGAGTLRIRPELSLGFPVADIARIEESADHKSLLMTTTFMGLYGVASPLPTFYTEDLMKDESTVTRDFLDIIHQRLYALLFETWKKHRLAIQITEAKNKTLLDMLYAICGGATSFQLIRYAGLLGSHPRSALGLSTMLSDFLGGVPVDVIPFISRAVQIPQDQQLRLGRSQHCLGKDSFIGQEFIDRQGKFRVRIGPLDQGPFHDLLLDGKNHAPLVAMVRSYLTDPLDYDFELVLKGKDKRPVCLGQSQWTRLGLDTMLYSDDFGDDMRVVFPAAERDWRNAA